MKKDGDIFIDLSIMVFVLMMTWFLPNGQNINIDMNTYQLKQMWLDIDELHALKQFNDINLKLFEWISQCGTSNLQKL